MKRNVPATRLARKVSATTCHLCVSSVDCQFCNLTCSCHVHERAHANGPRKQGDDCLAGLRGRVRNHAHATGRKQRHSGRSRNITQATREFSFQNLNTPSCKSSSRFFLKLSGGDVSRYIRQTPLATETPSGRIPTIHVTCGNREARRAVDCTLRRTSKRSRRHRTALSPHCLCAQS